MWQHLFAFGLDGTALFYERLGQGPPVVLCDGFLCDGYIWKYLTSSLKDKCEFIHWHYPGHGKSQDPPRFSDLSPPRLAADLKSVADQAGLQRVAIAGHSFGVQIALETWRRYPELVDSLILICGSPGNLIRDFHESAILGYVMPVLDAIERFVPRLATAVWRRLPTKQLLWLSLHLKEVNPQLIDIKDLEEYLQQLTRVDFNVALRMLENAGRHDATPYLDKIDVPVLIIAGRDDRFTPPSRSELMAKMIPHAELTMVPGGTHSLPVEQPDLVNLMIRRFLFGPD